MELKTGATAHIYSKQTAEEAGALLREGQLVAFPTETVYGLGANIYNEAAVRGIFEAKERPLSDPLIVHIHSPEQVHEIMQPNAAVLELVNLLAKYFWPGPLTMVVRAKTTIPDLVTASTGFVGMRFPNHEVA